MIATTRILVRYIFLFELCLFIFSCNQEKKTLFTLLDAGSTSIKFSNRIFENDSVNIIDNEYVYNWMRHFYLPLNYFYIHERNH